ncbi:MAG: peptidoglycan DD-metalloendopeptidase family protein [Ignavibacteriaceae bacterium]
MKKFYYFSEKTLNFLEIKNFRAKLISFFIGSVVIFSSILFGVVYLLSNLSSNADKLHTLKNENQLLKEKLKTISNNYSELENKLQDLTNVSNDLRLAANLEPISVEERLLGIGGSKTIDNLFSGKLTDIEDALKNIDNVTRKFEFEKLQFDEISTKLKTNKNLYESIPAIIPTLGHYSSESFGMRLHPVLGVMKMHNGLDIIANVGTPVKATGKGKIVFVGRKNGYGFAVEIDHGFGYRTIYGHLSSAKVKEGQIVRRGDLIAKTGNSGLSSGPHLHYEVLHDGHNLNPAEFFFDEYNYFESTNSY